MRVHAIIVEGDKERIQVFEGVCIRRTGGGPASTFTVRKSLVRRRRRAHLPDPLAAHREDRGEEPRPRPPRRLYYLRELSGKAARIKERKAS